MVDLGLLHFVVEDAVLEGLEDLVADVEVDVEFLDVGDEVFADEAALGGVDLFEEVGLEHGDEAALVDLDDLQLHLGDGLLPQGVGVGCKLVAGLPSARTVLVVHQRLQVHLDRLAQLELLLGVHQQAHFSLLFIVLYLHVR